LFGAPQPNLLRLLFFADRATSGRNTKKFLTAWSSWWGSFQYLHSTSPRHELGLLGNTFGDASSFPRRLSIQLEMAAHPIQFEMRNRKGFNSWTLGLIVGKVPPRIKRVTWEHRHPHLTLPDAKMLLDNRYMPFPVNSDAASPLLTLSNRCPSRAVYLSSPPPPPLRRPPLVTIRFVRFGPAYGRAAPFHFGPQIAVPWLQGLLFLFSTREFHPPLSRNGGPHIADDGSSRAETGPMLMKLSHYVQPLSLNGRTRF
jgi:hypothetical protein